MTILKSLRKTYASLDMVDHVLMIVSAVILAAPHFAWIIALLVFTYYLFIFGRDLAKSLEETSGINN